MMRRVRAALLLTAILGATAACTPPAPTTGDCAHPAPAADLHGCNFAGSSTLALLDLSGANLRGANLSGGATLYATNFTGADLTGANLDDAAMSEAQLTNANLTNATLRRAYLHGIDASGADLTGAHLDNADMFGGDFTTARLTGAVWAGATISGTNFTGATGADFTGASICGATAPSGELDFSGCPEQDPAPPAFYISNAAPAPGYSVTVRGKGCPAGNAISATIQMAPNAPISVFTGASDSVGGWTFQMPSFTGIVPPGVYQMTATCGAPGGFAYTPKSILLP